MPSTTVNNIIDLFNVEFNSRVNTDYLKHRTDVTGSLEIKMNEEELRLCLTRNGEVSAVTIPLPFIEDGVEFLKQKETVRPTCKYFIKVINATYTYLDAVKEILFGSPSLVVPNDLHKSKSHTMQLIKYGYENDSLGYTVYSLQKKLNFLIHKLPIHSTYMNSYVMNKRITIIDPLFDELTNPIDQYDYQVEKNKEYFDKGWTSLGLSDGSLANDNYMLSTDLRLLTPFGKKMHNPQRNLYSTLGMKGDEKPLVMTKSMKELDDVGISRTGWNFFTAFVDIPDVWEDQIMVDVSHADKFIERTKKYICYGELLVKVGDVVKYGTTLFIDMNEENFDFDVTCDYAEIAELIHGTSVVGGVEYNSSTIIVKYRRCFKDGTKITNLAANKGVIRLKELGYAIDPRTGKERKIDVIVSSKAVLKRKNYTQIVEALINTVNNENAILVEDEAEVTEAEIKSALVASGINEEGTWDCKTYVGDMKCVCGSVFWGVTHDADDTIWQEGKVEKTNGKGNRISGLKFSTIEFRALNTRFGNDNPIEKEVLTYSQGTNDIKEHVNIVRSKLGRYVYNTDTIEVMDIAPAVSNGSMFTEEELRNTIMDPMIRKEGFYLKLPIEYQVVIGENDKILCDGFPGQVGDEINGEKVKSKIIIDKVYVPCYNIRKCWKHSVGKYGLSELGALLNVVVLMCHKYDNDPSSSTHLTMIYRALFNYFTAAKSRLTTKRGDISTLGMSVRYPYSVKGVATLSNNIPRDTVQIHTDAAKTLNVKEGDVVLVERFPCLGFMSIRPQKVTITNEESCRFTIRASGNSLGSLTLDFDGDVIYLASFHSEDAKKALLKEWETPNKHCGEQINKFNEKMGTPRTKEMSLSDYEISSFDALNSETHAGIVGKLTGVKSYTGPIVALAYNLLRIMENSSIEHSQETKCGIEVFIDTVANSVFKQKHGKKSLHKVVTDAVCTADVETLVSEGFDRKIAKIVCSTIKEKAAERGIKDLIYHYNKTKGKSTIINRIVREENKLYYTSRASVDDVAILNNLSSTPVDIPSDIFNKTMSGECRVDRTELDKAKDEELISKLAYRTNEEYNNVKSLFKAIDSIFSR